MILNGFNISCSLGKQSNNVVYWNAPLPVFCRLVDASKLKLTIFTNRHIATALLIYIYIYIYIHIAFKHVYERLYYSPITPNACFAVRVAFFLLFLLAVSGLCPIYAPRVFAGMFWGWKKVTLSRKVPHVIKFFFHCPIEWMGLPLWWQNFTVA